MTYNKKQEAKKWRVYKIEKDKAAIQARRQARMSNKGYK